MGMELIEDYVSGGTRQLPGYVHEFLTFSLSEVSAENAWFVQNTSESWVVF